MDDTPANISIFDKAMQKFNKCDNAEQFFGQKSCSAFHHQFDNNMDILAMCGTCRLNTSEPTSKQKNIRFS